MGKIKKVAKAVLNFSPIMSYVNHFMKVNKGSRFRESIVGTAHLAYAAVGIGLVFSYLSFIGQTGSLNPVTQYTTVRDQVLSGEEKLKFRKELSDKVVCGGCLADRDKDGNMSIAEMLDFYNRAGVSEAKLSVVKEGGISIEEMKKALNSYGVD